MIDTKLALASAKRSFEGANEQLHKAAQNVTLHAMIQCWVDGYEQCARDYGIEMKPKEEKNDAQMVPSEGQ